VTGKTLELEVRALRDLTAMAFGSQLAAPAPDGRRLRMVFGVTRAAEAVLAAPCHPHCDLRR
jgi:hypothetical protein